MGELDSATTTTRHFDNRASCFSLDSTSASYQEALEGSNRRRTVKALDAQGLHHSGFDVARGKSGVAHHQKLDLERHPEKAHRPDSPVQKKPDWIRVKAPVSEGYFATRKIVRDNGLHTVCEEAGCPNIGECWEKKHATFMIMGDTCTRACAFCNVKTGLPGALDASEPGHVADHARHRRVVADIRSDGAMTRGRALLLVSSGDSHRSAERRERVGNPGADPRRPADDERRLAGEEIFAKCGIGH